VFRCGITFVLSKAIAGIGNVEFFHARITMRLGKDGSGRDGNAAGIAFDERFLFDEHVELHGVNQKIVGFDGKLLEGGGHCLATCLINVPSVNAGGIYFGDSPRDCVFANAEGEFIAALGGELFGIVEAEDSALGVEDNGGGDDRTEQSAAAGFVDSGDARPAEFARSPLKTGRAETGHTARNFSTEKNGKFTESSIR